MFTFQCLIYALFYIIHKNIFAVDKVSFSGGGLPNIIPFCWNDFHEMLFFIHLPETARIKKKLCFWLTSAWGKFPRSDVNCLRDFLHWEPFPNHPTASQRYKYLDFYSAQTFSFFYTNNLHLTIENFLILHFFSGFLGWPYFFFQKAHTR